jgi:NADH-quinone oxidoreductase subunit M
MTTLSLDLLRALLVLLLALPAAAAVVVALLGARRLHAIRRLSLAVVVADLVIAIVLAIGMAEIRASPPPKMAQGEVPTFRPEIVPGATDKDPHRTTWDLVSVGAGPGKAAEGEAGPPEAVQFFIGLDGLSVWLVLLTALLMVPSVLISWEAITERANEYYAWLLALGTGMLGVFVSFDIILFYVFFELTLVPLFFLIGIWGGPERRLAARKFFIYTLAGSLITLLGVLAVVAACYDAGNPQAAAEQKPAGSKEGQAHRLTFSIPELVQTVNANLRKADEDHARASRPETVQTTLQTVRSWATFQFWVFLALIAGFSIKVPLVPLHTWLPLAHTEAPTAGSVLLAGVLLKIGTYGFLRLALPLAPDTAASLGVPLIGTLAVIGILYGAFCALSQDDMKKLVAYSSVSHLGFCMLGMFALNQAGLGGSLLQMINHGLSTGALFLLVGMIYDRYHTRKIADYGGMGARLGLLTACMVFISLSSIGLPGLNGFVGEALVFLGMFQREPWLAVVGTAGILLGAWYLLTLVMRVFCGPVKEPHHAGQGPVGDMNLREWLALGPIMALCLVLGVYPQPVLETARRDLQVVSDLVSRPAAGGPSLAGGQGNEARPAPAGGGKQGE